MKKRFSKLMAIVMVFALIVAFAAIPASAATTYTPIDGGSTTMQKNLVIDSDAKVPNISFNYTIAAGIPRAASATTIEILAGPVVQDSTTGAVTAPSIVAATFTGNETTTNGTPSDPAGSPTTGKKYATENAIIDLSGVNFSKPGVYRYFINEVNDALPGITYDTTTRYLDVYVTADANDTLSVSKYVLRKSPDNINIPADSSSNPTYSGENPDEKSAGYTNSLSTFDLEFTKTITGNQADKNKLFAFKLELMDANPGTYKIILADGSESTISVDATGSSANKYEQTYQLTNDQSIKVVGLNQGASYNISEVSQDYTPSVVVTGNGATVAQTNDRVSGTLNGNIKADFTNTRDGVIPTGVLLTIAPFAIGLLLFGALAIFFIARKKKKAEEE